MSEILVIPYGTPLLRSDQVSIQDGAVACPVPFIRIDKYRDGILRLNGAQYDFPEPPDLRTMTDAAAQLAFLHSHLALYGDLWARPPKLFLERYFAFVRHCVDANRRSLKNMLEPFGSLFAVEDWALSAPRPLPRSHLSVGGTFHPVDFAFWLGDRIVAVLLIGTATTRDQGRQTALRTAGVETVEISNSDLVSAGPEYLHSALPTVFASFWEGEVMPSSPFKGTSLGDIVPG